MAKLPESLLAGLGGGSSSFFSVQPPLAMPRDLQSATVDQLIRLLRDPEYREEAISQLTKRRERCRELGQKLWNSTDTVFILLEEVMSIYKLLSPGKLSTRESNRVCNALALLQSMASQAEVKIAFINAKIPVYMYPFLNTTSVDKPFEYLRLTSLGVIGALVKVDDSNGPQVVHFLLESEVLPLCLRCMEVGDELSKTVATFILSKILMHEEGLSYCCASAERFYAVSHIMRGMIEKMGNVPLFRLLKHIIHCYLSLSGMPRACDALQRCFPMKLKDPVFLSVLAEEPMTMRMVEQLFYNVMVGHWHKPKPEPSGDVFPQRP